MSDTESNPGPLGAADAPIPAENGPREAEYAPRSEGGVGSGGGTEGSAPEPHKRDPAFTRGEYLVVPSV